MVLRVVHARPMHEASTDGRLALNQSSQAISRRLWIVSGFSGGGRYVPLICRELVERESQACRRPRSTSRA